MPAGPGHRPLLPLAPAPPPAWGRLGAPGGPAAAASLAAPFVWETAGVLRPTRHCPIPRPARERSRPAPAAQLLGPRRCRLWWTRSLPRSSTDCPQGPSSDSTLLTHAPWALLCALIPAASVPSLTHLHSSWRFVPPSPPLTPPVQIGRAWVVDDFFVVFVCLILLKLKQTASHLIWGDNLCKGLISK